jgi:putative nucleotidyltransferase with HDIG domain
MPKLKKAKSSRMGRRLRMADFTPDRDKALVVLKGYVHSDNLIRHALSVEAAMKHFAALFGEDEAKWGIIGLLHDIDYEMYPDRHCQMTREILSKHGFPEEYIRAAESHGYKFVNDIKPEHKMEKVLYAVDELTGLIAAAVYVRPSRSIMDLEVSSVTKKWKQKGFAAGVNREVIEGGAGMLGVQLDYLIGETIKGMKAEADALGLKGQA